MQTSIESNNVTLERQTYDSPKLTPVVTSKNSISEDIKTDNVKRESSLNSLSYKTSANIINDVDLYQITDVKDPRNEKCDMEKKSSQILKLTISQAEVIFNAKRKARAPKSNGINKKKSGNYNRTILVKNIHFKNEHAGMNMTRKFKKYYKRTKINLNNLQKIQENLHCDKLSEKVSRRHFLKTVHAKENLLREAEITFEKNSLSISNSSQGTLRREDSSSSRSYDVTTTNSVIRVKDSKIMPYKTDIINVAVAQVNNATNIQRNSLSTVIAIREKDFTESLTSTETVLSDTIMLTSKYSLKEPNKSSNREVSDASSSNSNGMSNETLIPPGKISGTSSDTFEIARSSSYFHNSDMQSDSTLKQNPVDLFQDVDIKDFQINDKKNDHTSQFYNAIMDVYTKIAPGSTPVPNYPNNDNVIIADDTLKSPLEIEKTKNRDDERFSSLKNEYPNIFHKPLPAQNTINYLKNINLPNATQLKNNMVDPSSQRKCSEEAKHTNPASFPELFDRLSIVLEIALKRLEITLSEKIVSELRKSLHEFKNQVHPIPNFDFTSETMSKRILTGDLKESNNTIEALTQFDAFAQCDIIQNEFIDELMTNEIANSVQSSSNYTQKLKKPKLLKDYFEILKAPVPSYMKDQELGKGDSIQVSIEDAVEQPTGQSDCTKKFFSIPKRFLRENMFVITSVPAFLFVMFVIYAYVLLIFKMWYFVYRSEVLRQ